jgi:hypothetical protein
VRKSFPLNSGHSRRRFLLQSSFILASIPVFNTRPVTYSAGGIVLHCCFRDLLIFGHTSHAGTVLRSFNPVSLLKSAAQDSSSPFAPPSTQPPQVLIQPPFVHFISDNNIWRFNSRSGKTLVPPHALLVLHFQIDTHLRPAYRGNYAVFIFHLHSI